MKEAKDVTVVGKNNNPLFIGLENVVIAFLGGIQPAIRDANAPALRDKVDCTQAVCVGTYHTLSTDILIDSDVVTACALQGVKAKDIVDALLKMRFTDLEGVQHAVVTADVHKGIESPAIATLDAVYVACRHVLHSKILRNALANKPKTK